MDGCLPPVHGDIVDLVEENKYFRTGNHQRQLLTQLFIEMKTTWSSPHKSNLSISIIILSCVFYSSPRISGHRRPFLGGGGGLTHTRVAGPTSIPWLPLYCCVHVLVVTLPQYPFKALLLCVRTLKAMSNLRLNKLYQVFEDITHDC